MKSKYGIIPALLICLASWSCTRSVPAPPVPENARASTGSGAASSRSQILPFGQEPYAIGAWYFGAWSQLNVYQAGLSQQYFNRFDPWGGIRDVYQNPSLVPDNADGSFLTRKPQAGFYDQVDQSVMDTHIQQAASRGLSYFAFYQYWNTDLGSEYHPSSNPLLRFLSSPYKNLMKFSITTLTLGGAADKGTTSLSTFETRMVPFLVNTYISDPSYLTTEDGRPIIQYWDGQFGLSDADLSAGIAYLRDYVLITLGKNPLILGMADQQTPAQLAAQATSGADGFYCFTLNLLVGQGDVGVAEDYASRVSDWGSQITAAMGGYMHLPCTTIGADARPWSLLIPAYQAWNHTVNRTPAAFANHLATIKSYIDETPNALPALTIYAWNEWGEGGYIEPDVTYNTGYIDAIQNTFGLTARTAAPASTSTDAVYNFTSGCTVQFCYPAVITEIFTTFLGRKPVQSELDLYSGQLQNSVSKLDLIHAIMGCSEYQSDWSTQLSTADASLQLLFSQILGRSPTAAEVERFSPYVQGSFTAVADNLLFSAEATSLHPLLYPDYGSPPDLGGSSTAAVYRLRSATDYLMTSDLAEALYAQMQYGYTFESKVFTLLQAASPGTLPLMRCRVTATGGHFLSTTANCEGQIVEGVLGYVETQQQPGTYQLLRYVGPTHLTLISSDSAEVASMASYNYTFEQYQGFAFP